MLTAQGSQPGVQSARQEDGTMVTLAFVLWCFGEGCRLEDVLKDDIYIYFKDCTIAHLQDHKVTFHELGEFSV